MDGSEQIINDIGQLFLKKTFFSLAMAIHFFKECPNLVVDASHFCCRRFASHAKVFGSILQLPQSSSILGDKYLGHAPH